MNIVISQVYVIMRGGTQRAIEATTNPEIFYDAYVSTLTYVVNDIYDVDVAPARACMGATARAVLKKL